MVIGVETWDLSLRECRSLKEKRRVVKSLKERMQQRFRVSVAETGHQDTWTRAQLTAALVAADAGQADSMMDALDSFVERDGRAIITGVHRSHR